MYPGPHARERAGQAAFVMASTGQSVSYAEYEARTNRLAHLLRARGLGRLDHYAIFMENNDRYLEACGAGERAGLYYTCVNSYLTAPELAYILNNSTSRLLITSRGCRQVALEAGHPGHALFSMRRHQTKPLGIARRRSGFGRCPSPLPGDRLPFPRLCLRSAHGFVPTCE